MKHRFFINLEEQYIFDIKMIGEGDHYFLHSHLMKYVKDCRTILT